MSEPRHGTVHAVRGSVVDARFPHGLPAIHNLLRAGDRGEVAIEVDAHLGADAVRGVALTSTQGLPRGARVVDTGGPIEVPVGECLLGRVVDVFGAPIDGKDLLAPLERGGKAGLFGGAVFRALAESAASEHASRLAAMQAAERNVADELEALRAELQRRRQDAITAELLDVVSGYEVLTGRGSR